MRQTRRFSAAAIAILAAGLTGCQGMAWWASWSAKDKEVPAQYRPPQDKTTLVFVDDFYRVTDYEQIRPMLAERITRELRKNKVVDETVAPERLMELEASTPYFSQLSVSEIARKLEAGAVVYVVLDRFSLKDDPASLLWRGKLQVTVRVVDSETGRRLWPQDARDDGHPMQPVELPPVDDSSETYGEEVARKLADEMADRVAKLFYDHKVSQKPGGGRSAFEQ